MCGGDGGTKESSTEGSKLDGADWFGGDWIWDGYWKEKGVALVEWGFYPTREV